MIKLINVIMIDNITWGRKETASLLLPRRRDCWRHWSFVLKQDLSPIYIYTHIHKICKFQLAKLG